MNIPVYSHRVLPVCLLVRIGSLVLIFTALSGVFCRAQKESDKPQGRLSKGNCWDNAPSEALFASLKVERLHGKCFDTIRQAKDEVLNWLLWYNQTRMHSTLGYVSPMRFEQDWYRSTAAVAN
jgi:transposase InsO family protein